MYRPTVRMADVYQSYLDDLHQVTRLDRNQLIRLAIFAAAHSEPFREILNEYKKADVHLPPPPWELYEDEFFLEKDPKNKKGERDVNANSTRTGEASKANRNVVGGKLGGQQTGAGRFEQVARRGREVPSESIAIKNQGGISFTFN